MIFAQSFSLQFHGAEIAIVEVKEGLQRHYPACIAHANVRIPKDLRTITPRSFSSLFIRNFSVYFFAQDTSAQKRNESYREEIKKGKIKQRNAAWFAS